jgi:hypothetical protein
MERKAWTLGLRLLGSTGWASGWSSEAAKTEAKPSKSVFLWVVTIFTASPPSYIAKKLKLHTNCVIQIHHFFVAPAGITINDNSPVSR